MYTAGAVLGQLPFTFLFPMFPMNWIIPGLEMGWGIFTLLQYRVQSYGEFMAYRFMVGVFEVCWKSALTPKAERLDEAADERFTRQHFFPEYITYWVRGIEEMSWGGGVESSTPARCWET